MGVGLQRAALILRSLPPLFWLGVDSLVQSLERHLFEKAELGDGAGWAAADVPGCAELAVLGLQRLLCSPCRPARPPGNRSPVLGNPHPSCHHPMAGRVLCPHRVPAGCREEKQKLGTAQSWDKTCRAGRAWLRG